MHRRCFLYVFGTPSKYRCRFIGRDDPVLRIPLVTDDLYLIHGAKNVAEGLRATSLSVTWSMGFVLGHCFGMSRKAVGVYYNDTSGPRKRPNPGSRTEPTSRIYLKTHEILLEGLLRQGLAPTTTRLETEWMTAISSLQISNDWVAFPDLLGFYQSFLGTVVIETIFGSTLLSLNPSFIQDLWSFDPTVMSLAKRLPIIFTPRAYWLRRRLLQSIKKWHNYARIHSPRHHSVGDQDEDPYWGCKMIRDRYATLRDIENQDQDSLASTDLAFIWS